MTTITTTTTIIIRIRPILRLIITTIILSQLMRLA